jgi:hypothetical protein
MAMMICIIAIGALLVEYMCDGTIYNRAFNAFCLIVILLFAADTSISIYNCIFNTSDALVVGIDRSIFRMHMLLLVFNNAYHVIMTFLLVFFAYDSAKAQLKKAKIET